MLSREAPNKRTPAEPELAANPRIGEALKRTMATSDASVLVVGYAAYGREQAGTSLDLIHEALTKETLKAGSTVVLHVSGHEQSPEQLKALERLQVELQKKDIAVVVAAAPKSLKDALFHDHLSVERKKISSLEEAGLLERADQNGTSLSPAAEVDALTASLQRLQKLHTLKADDLMKSLARIVGTDGMKNKVMVLTDSNHDLQEAAKVYDVPAEHRLNQQKNDVGFDIRSREKGKQAGLSGTFRQNEKALLGKMKDGLAELKANSTNRAEVRNQTVNYLLANARNAAGTKIDNKTQGVLCHSSVRYNYPKTPNIKNIVYIADEAHQDIIAEHVKRQLEKEPPPPDYKETMFVFCGPDAVPGVDAMALAQIADADGIFSKGAQEERNHSYLCGLAGSQAKAVAVMPLKEGEKGVSAEEFLRNFDASVKHWRDGAEAKYANGNTLKQLNARIERSNSISAGHDFLFSNATKKEKDSKPIGYIDIDRNQTTQLANKKFRKMMEQILVHVKTRSDEASKEDSIEWQLGSGSQPVMFSLRELADSLDKEDGLMRPLTESAAGERSGEDDVSEKDILFFNELKEYLRIVVDDQSLQEDLDADRAALTDLATEPKTPTYLALRELEYRMKGAQPQRTALPEEA